MRPSELLCQRQILEVASTCTASTGFPLECAHIYPRSRLLASHCSTGLTPTRPQLAKLPSGSESGASKIYAGASPSHHTPVVTGQRQTVLQAARRQAYGSGASPCRRLECWPHPVLEEVVGPEPRTAPRVDMHELLRALRDLAQRPGRGGAGGLRGRRQHAPPLRGPSWRHRHRSRCPSRAAASRQPPTQPQAVAAPARPAGGASVSPVRRGAAAGPGRPEWRTMLSDGGSERREAVYEPHAGFSRGP